MSAQAQTPLRPLDTRSGAQLPMRAGVGLKHEHYRDVIEGEPDIGFFEVHAENYMGAGGPPHHYLERIRRDHALSIHGVGLSIGADAPLDKLHLERLRNLLQRYEPQSFSEHLAWSSHGDHYFADLLPLPYDDKTLAVVCQHVGQVQDFLKRPLLLENPSTYVEFESTSMAEVDFLIEVVARTGCGLLLDVNNVFVSCSNHNTNPYRYIDLFPHCSVGEIHLAGFAFDKDAAGDPLLIDSHGCAVFDEVWALYAHAIEKCGPVATLIEWDNDIPDFDTLSREAWRAEKLLCACDHPGLRAEP